MGKSCPKRAIATWFAVRNQIKMKIKSNQDDFPWGKNSRILVENFGGANENLPTDHPTAKMAGCQNGRCQNGRPAKMAVPPEWQCQNGRHRIAHTGRRRERV